MADAPEKSVIPLQFEIGSPAAAPGENKVLVPGPDPDAPVKIMDGSEFMARQQAAETAAAAAAEPANCCGGCRWFSLEAGRAQIGMMGDPRAGICPTPEGRRAIFDSKGNPMFSGERQRLLDSLREMFRFNPGSAAHMGACGMELTGAATLTLDTAPACEAWEPAGKLVSFSGQRLRSS